MNTDRNHEKLYAGSTDEFDDVDDYSDDEDEDEEFVESVILSYACEDCDYRWETTFESEEDAEIDELQICPMCGSSNTTQI